MADLISSLPGSAPKPKRVLDALIRYGLLLVLAAVVVFFSIAEPAFLRINNLFIILQSVSIVALLALGVTLTMAVGGLDLSIGAVAAMSLMIASYVMVVLGWGAVPAVLISLAGGALVGLFNGWLIVKMRVPDILATLGSMFLVIGVQLIPTGGRSIAVGMTLPNGEETEGVFSAAFLALGRGRLWDTVPVPVLVTAVAALAVWLFLERAHRPVVLCHRRQRASGAPGGRSGASLQTTGVRAVVLAGVSGRFAAGGAAGARRCQLRQRAGAGCTGRSTDWFCSAGREEAQRVWHVDRRVTGGHLAQWIDDAQRTLLRPGFRQRTGVGTGADFYLWCRTARALIWTP